MRFTCKDGSEWEATHTCVEKGEFYIKRIQPKEKSLYEKCKEKIFGDVPYEPKESRHLELLCQHIEALEKRLEDWAYTVANIGKKLDAIERACERESRRSDLLMSFADIILEELKK